MAIRDAIRRALRRDVDLGDADSRPLVGEEAWPGRDIDLVSIRDLRQS